MRGISACVYTKFQLDAEAESNLKDVPQDQQLDNNTTWVNLMLGNVFNILYSFDVEYIDFMKF